VDFDEDFLGEVIGIIVVDYHLAYVPIHPLLIGAYQHIKAVIPRIGITDFEQEFFVFQTMFCKNES
jgi:hypothetical protein